jgi:hypothetical protein
VEREIRREMIGQVFERLTVVAQAGTRRGEKLWRCECSCGKAMVTGDSRLRLGHTRSCGCLKVDVVRARSTRHGHAGRGLITPEYRAWRDMISRCTVPTVRNFQDYGGRGIVVCDAWRSDFGAFVADVGPRPSPLHSLDRIDNSGNYEPSNCRWATRSEQGNNTRVNRHIVAFGIKMTLAQWSRAVRLDIRTVHARLKLGWSPERAVGFQVLFIGC